MNTEQRRVYAIPLDLIDDAGRLRPVDPDYVALIAASMAERGLDTPIVVGEANPAGQHRLIAGAHRLAAARSLGWAKIDALTSSADEMQAKLQEIDENLIRRELSALDRAVFLAERKTIYEALNPETGHGKARKRADLEKSASLHSLSVAFDKATGKKLGVDPSTIRRAVRRAALPADIRAAIANHPVAESGADLDKLIGLTPERQRLVVELLIGADDAPANVSAALARLSGPASTSRAAQTAKEMNALLAAWRKAGKAARNQFLDFLSSEREIPERPAKLAPTASGKRASGATGAQT